MILNMRKGGFDMETKKMVKEILNALKLHSKHMDQKFKKVDEIRTNR